MSTISATIDVDNNSVNVIVELLMQFPMGRRVRVALTDEPLAVSEPDLVDWLLACPEKGWFTPGLPGDTTDKLKPVVFE